MLYFISRYDKNGRMPMYSKISVTASKSVDPGTSITFCGAVQPISRLNKYSITKLYSMTPFSIQIAKVATEQHHQKNHSSSHRYFSCTISATDLISAIALDQVFRYFVYLEIGANANEHDLRDSI
jgi:hypothetical protein